jgi:hypothetical protein
VTDENIPNKKRITPKYSYHKDANMQYPLSKEFIADQKRRSERFIKKGRGKK